jgi:glycosyltransferase 2 family protein
MTEAEGGLTRKPASHRGKVLAGYLLAAICLAWVFHDVEYRDLFRNLGATAWPLVGVAVLFDILSYACQGWRWSLLLRTKGRLTALKATQAIYAGLFVNEIIPMRAGEVLRIYLASKWMPVEFAGVVPSVLVERFFDAIWLALAIGVTILFVPLPQYLVDAEEILAIIIFAGTALFAFLVLRKQHSEAEADPRPGLAGRFSSLMSGLARGLHAIGRSNLLSASFLVSFLLLFFQVLAFWLVMWGYGLRLSFWYGAAVLLIVHLGTAIPGAPSNIGTYQFFTVIGLTQFGVDKTTATGFSVVVFLILTIPLWVIGIFAFGRAGLSLHGLTTRMSTLPGTDPAG